MNYLTADEIEARLDRLASENPGLCSKIPPVPLFTAPKDPADAPPGVPGRTLRILKIGLPAAPGKTKTPVLITGGLHAREWAPPDALVSFCERLVKEGLGPAPQRKPRPLRYPLLVVPDRPMPLPSMPVPAPLVKAIFEELDLYVVPLCNPDGRVYSQKQPTGGVDFARWRKNRARTRDTLPCPPDKYGLDQSVGTDLNRNIDVDFDIDQFYSRDFYDEGWVHTAKDPCGTPIPQPPLTSVMDVDGESYHGDNPFSEAETQVLKNLIDNVNPTYMADCHSYGPTILHSWGTLDIQSTAPEKNFRNPSWDGQRSNTGYGEYVPPDLAATAENIAGQMSWCIELMKRGYPPSPSSAGAYEVQVSAQLYAGAGIADYLMSRQYTVPVPPDFRIDVVPPARYPFTIECGSGRENGFWPLRSTQFPKIERELHWGLWGFLKMAAAPHATIPFRAGP